MRINFMKKITLFLFLMYSCHLTQAQVATPKKIGVVAGSNYKDTLKNADIRERLVQLAMNNPGYEISDRQTYIALYQLHMAKGNWLAALSAQGNMNEFTINSIFGSGSANNCITPNTILGLASPLTFLRAIPIQSKSQGKTIISPRHRKMTVSAK